jgi:hypothetical protein
MVANEVRNLGRKDEVNCQPSKPDANFRRVSQVVTKDGCHRVEKPEFMI